jgi:arylamine N-acetyltransferase
MGAPRIDAEFDTRCEPIFDRYLRRLGCDTRSPADLEFLTRLMARHLQTVPFENLDIVRGTPRPLSTDSALRKVADEGRGGFCYELNEAFRALLQDLGFAVHRVEARVWQPEAQRFGPPFDHLALVVTLPEGNFLVDVGYGDGNRAPLRMPQDRAQDVSGDYVLGPAREGCLCLVSQARPLYELTLATQPLQAFAAMCTYHRSSPDSFFSKGLLCTRATPAGRITLSRDRLIVVADGRRSETPVANPAVVLAQQFGITDWR